MAAFASPGHELDRRGVLAVVAPGRAGMTDPGEPLHVDAEVGLHDPSDSGPADVRAGVPIQTWPSVNCSAFQIGARAFVSSIA